MLLTSIKVSAPTSFLVSVLAEISFALMELWVPAACPCQGTVWTSYAEIFMVLCTLSAPPAIVSLATGLREVRLRKKFIEHTIEHRELEAARRARDELIEDSEVKHAISRAQDPEELVALLESKFTAGMFKQGRRNKRRASFSLEASASERRSAKQLVPKQDTFKVLTDSKAPKEFKAAWFALVVSEGLISVSACNTFLDKHKTSARLLIYLRDKAGRSRFFSWPLHRLLCASTSLSPHTTHTHTHIRTRARARASRL